MVAGLLLNYLDERRSIACIRTLLDEGIERVLVWDNSADEGRSAGQICVAFENDPRIVVEVHGANIGFAAGANRGLEICRERFQASHVLLINNDASLRPGALSVLRAASLGNAQAGVISMDIAHAGHAQGPLHYHRWSGLQYRRALPGTFPYASGCCLWVDLTLAPSPLFDEVFFMYGEDCELGWRLSQQPVSWLHLPQVLVDHEGSASSGLGSPFYETHLVAAHLLLARKLARHPFSAIGFTLLRMPFLIARATIRSLRYRSFVPWQGFWRGAVLAFGPRRGLR